MLNVGLNKDNRGNTSLRSSLEVSSFLFVIPWNRSLFFSLFLTKHRKKHVSPEVCCQSKVSCYHQTGYELSTLSRYPRESTTFTRRERHSSLLNRLNTCIYRIWGLTVVVLTDLPLSSLSWWISARGQRGFDPRRKNNCLPTSFLTTIHPPATVKDKQLYPPLNSLRFTVKARFPRRSASSSFGRDLMLRE